MERASALIASLICGAIVAGLAIVAWSGDLTPPAAGIALLAMIAIKTAADRGIPTQP